MRRILKRMVLVIVTIALCGQCVWMGEVTPVYAQEQMCYSISPQLTTATLDYLTEIYIEENPDFGLEFLHGTPQDREVLQILADKITVDCTSQKEMANAISGWVKRNIKYASFFEGDVYTFATDAFYNRKTNCDGYAALISQLCRLKGIPAVNCAGMRGDLENYVTLSYVTENVGHAWVYAYYDNEWHLFDPIYDVYDSTDLDYQAHWYFPQYIEGITMSAPGIDKNLYTRGTGAFYENGGFFEYWEGMLSYEYYDTNFCIANMLSINFHNYSGAAYFDYECNGMNIVSQYSYFNDEEKNKALRNSEYITNGWVKTRGAYGYKGLEYPNGFVYPNGVFKSYCIDYIGDELYVFNHSGSPIQLSDKNKEYYMRGGYIEIEVGESIKIAEELLAEVRDRLEKEQAEDGCQRRYYFEVYSDDGDKVVEVSNDGVITGVTPGFVNVCANVETIWSDGVIGYSNFLPYLPIYVVENHDRVINYEDCSNPEEVKYAEYLGKSYTKDADGTVRSYTNEGELIINEFGCDGEYTYYFQADGTAMTNRLTYHPDGDPNHVIYFDENGHEVFSNFANVKMTIAGEEVDDLCFFDVNGYLYVDVITYDQAGEKIYYANPYGVMECNKWFEFSDNVKWADGTPFDKAGGKYGYANAAGTLMTNQWTYDWEGRYCYMQGNGVALY